MLGKRIRPRWWFAGVGFSVGAALGIGLLMGSMFSPARPEIPLHAVATHSNDSLAMATFEIDGGVEGLATLDTLTGELKVFVMNPRTFKFNMAGKTNVLAPLKVEKGKKVSLLMVSGVTRFVGAAGAGVNVAGGCVYVMDGNSGRFICYNFAFAPNALATGVEGEVVITALDGNTARTVNI
jgi:hypothetical protein